MHRILAITNQKGGVGKTTTTVNLAASLAATKRRVLLIDIDPQGNATMGCGVDKRSLELSMTDVLLGDCELAAAMVQVDPGHFTLVPGNQDLVAAEVQLMTMIGREVRLRNALKPVRDHYEVILIDCPPSLNLLTLNAMVAAHAVLVPVQCEFFALEGISQLKESIDQIRATLNPTLEIQGVVLTMHDARTSLSKEVADNVRAFFGPKVYETIIPRNIRVAEAPSHGKPILLYDYDCAGSQAYIRLATEIIERERQLRAA